MRTMVPEPAKELLQKILSLIATEQKLNRLRWQIGLVSTVSVASVTALLPAIKMFYGDITSSGFARLFSLLFSDPRLIVAAWNDFALSILESMPVMSILLVSSILFLLLGALRILFKDITKMHSYAVR